MLHDSIRHYFVFRNQWKDADDIVVTGLWGARKEKGPAECLMVWGLGEKHEWGACVRADKSKLEQVTKDGTGVVIAGDASLAVDFSNASGADALLVMVGPGTGGKLANGCAKPGSIAFAGATVHYLTLTKNVTHPDHRVEADTLWFGKQSVRVKDGKLLLGKTQ